MAIEYQVIDQAKIPLKLLLTGPSGAGKTTLAAQFPSPVIFNFDNNISCLKKFPQEMQKRIKIVNPHYKGGKKLPGKDVYGNFLQQLAEVYQDESVKTIVVDSLTTMAAHIFYKITGSDNPTTAVQIQHFGGFTRYMESFGNNLLADNELGKHIVIIAHEVLEKDELTNKMTINLNIPTKLKGSFGLYFTDIWRAFTRVKGKPEYLLRTAPIQEATYKCSLDLPFEFSWDDQKDIILKELEERLP